MKARHFFYTLIAVVMLFATAATLMASRKNQPTATAAASQPETDADSPRKLVAVELFTSEGCSSCPSADVALLDLETRQGIAGVEVLALGQHVDYWNRLGWRDPFSDAKYSERQREYAAALNASSYTPMAVVNGQYHFTGSDLKQLDATVKQAALAPTATVALQSTPQGTILLNISDLPPGTGPCQVLLAHTERGHKTHVTRGENAGRELRHASIVTRIDKLGTLTREQAYTDTLTLPKQLAQDGIYPRMVVLVQEIKTRKIVGLGQLPI